MRPWLWAPAFAGVTVEGVFWPTLDLCLDGRVLSDRRAAEADDWRVLPAMTILLRKIGCYPPDSHIHDGGACTAHEEMGDEKDCYRGIAVSNDGFCGFADLEGFLSRRNSR